MGAGREVQEGKDICTHIADSLHCTAETNTTLKAIILLLRKIVLVLYTEMFPGM